MEKNDELDKIFDAIAEYVEKEMYAFFMSSYGQKYIYKTEKVRISIEYTEKSLKMDKTKKKMIDEHLKKEKKPQFYIFVDGNKRFYDFRRKDGNRMLFYLDGKKEPILVVSHKNFLKYENRQPNKDKAKYSTVVLKDGTRYHNVLDLFYEGQYVILYYGYNKAFMKEITLKEATIHTIHKQNKYKRSEK